MNVRQSDKYSEILMSGDYSLNTPDPGNSLKLQPATRKTLSQTVAEQILQLIIEQPLKPGDALPSEKELTAHLQVGRSTVREALKALSALGIVDRQPGRGTVVRRVRAKNALCPDLLPLMLDSGLIRQLLEAREIIEPVIARLAAERASAEDLRAIEKVLEATQDAIHAGKPVYHLSPNFHRSVTEAAHNEVLLTFMDSILGLLPERSVVIEQKPGHVEWELVSHRGIYESIARRDGNEAKLKMEKHIEESTSELVRVS